MTGEGDHQPATAASAVTITAIGITGANRTGDIGIVMAAAEDEMTVAQSFTTKSLTIEGHRIAVGGRKVEIIIVLLAVPENRWTGMRCPG